MTTWKMVVAGEGGQGVQALADTLALAAYRAGKKSLYIPNFGIEQRGGVSLAMVQVSTQEIGAPKFLKADLVAALSPRSFERTRQYLDSRTIILYDNSIIKIPEVADEVVGLQTFDTVAPETYAGGSAGQGEKERVVEPRHGRYVAVPAADLAREKLHPRVFNMIILGAIVAITEVVGLSAIKRGLEEKLSHRFTGDSKMRENNFRALEMGFEQVPSAKTPT